MLPSGCRCLLGRCPLPPRVDEESLQQADRMLWPWQLSDLVPHVPGALAEARFAQDAPHGCPDHLRCALVGRDDLRHGQPFISFGENRYLGGANASPLNVDFDLPGATLIVDGRVVVNAAGVVV
jgi:hypothetical protein